MPDDLGAFVSTARGSLRMSSSLERLRSYLRAGVLTICTNSICRMPAFYSFLVHIGVICGALAWIAIKGANNLIHLLRRSFFAVQRASSAAD